MRILHLSDIHVCQENEEQFQVLCDGIIGALSNFSNMTVKPDAVLVTGDYTHSGSVEEFTMFKRPFKKMLENEVFSNVRHVILVPGNHDYPWVEKPRDENFCEFANELQRCDTIDNDLLNKQMSQENISHFYEECDGYRILLIGMNSMKIDSQERKGIGYFDLKQLTLVNEVIKHYKVRSSKVLYTFVAFHHHLLPVSYVERETISDKDKYSLTIDARRAIDCFLESDVSFALHGHQHQPSMFTISDDSGKHEGKSVHIIACGCLADRARLNDSGRKSFFLYEISEGSVSAVMAETTQDDADRFEWKTPRTYSMAVSTMPRINKERILYLAEKDNRWVKQVGEGQITGDDAVSIEDLVKMLVEGISEDGAVSYYAGKKTRYRTSTLATVLECMDDIGLLPKEDVLIMQKKLMRLRDYPEEVIKVSEHDDVITKLPEDMPAWGIDEAPSVWTTSKALTALFVTKYVPSSCEEEKKIRESIQWLVSQQYSSGGWGYQQYKESPVCHSSIPMTALALRAICLACQQHYIHTDEDSVNTTQIVNAIKKGAKYLLDKVIKNESDEVAYWQYDKSPSLTASVWAHQALTEAAYLLSNINNSYERISWSRQVKRFRKIERWVLDYVVKHLPTQDSAEALSETFFFAPIGSSLKYKPALAQKKDFKSFIPFVLSYLLKADPEYAESDEVKAMLKWVLNHKDTQWLLEDFNGESGDPCMISIAMSINIIVNWLQVTANMAIDKAISALMEGV